MRCWSLELTEWYTPPIHGRDGALCMAGVKKSFENPVLLMV